MASTYTLNQGIEKPAAGDQSGTWGATVNTNMDIIDRVVSGVGALTLTGSTTTLTTTDGTLSDGMYRVLVLGDSGDLGSNNTITISPNDADKLYLVYNNLSANRSAIFTQGSGANATVENGETAWIYADGAGSGAAVRVATSSTKLLDQDGDTGIRVEEGGDDDDTIRFDTAGSERMTVASDGTVDVAGDLTIGTVTADGDTSAGDNATIGYTAAEGLILTGQGSTSDITLKNDADGTVFTVPTGSDDILFADNAKAMWGTGSDLKIYHDGSHSYIEDAGTGELKLVSGGSTVLTVSSTGADAVGNLTATGTVEPAGDTSAGDNAAIGYTAGEGLILTGQGSTSDITIKNDADANVMTVATGTTVAAFASAPTGIITDKFFVRGSTQSNVTGDGTAYTMVFTNSEVYDPGGVFTTSTYTASVAGKAYLWYLIELGPFAADHDRMMIRIVTSNRDYVTIDMSPGGNITNNGGYRRFARSVVADMDASDTVTITVTVFNGSKVIDTTANTDCLFGGYLIKD
jgi:hypothetical protein